jgi:hypothetical protein
MKISISESQHADKAFMERFKENYPEAEISVLPDAFVKEWNETFLSIFNNFNTTGV